MTAPVAPAELVWSVKTAFAAYVQGMADGRVEVSGGVVAASDGTFVFPSETVSSSRWQFAGSVEFTGHSGLLSLAISRPAIEWRHDRLLLTIDDEEEGRLDFATLAEPLADPAGWIVEEVLLTHDGADLFFGSYRRGTEFDRLTVRGDPPRLRFGDAAESVAKP
ncbi:MAG TPA: HtaA domain-containing protein [Microbacterium sp.]|nr:HtaA domain-containing protein [Microbacterium sp.]